MGTTSSTDPRSVKAPETTPEATPPEAQRNPATTTPASSITFEQFQAVDVRVGEVQLAEPLPATDKLVKLGVNFGEMGTRIVLAGIAKSYPEYTKLVGQRLAFVVNLQPRTMAGIESQAMLLAAPVDGGQVVPVTCPGAKIGARLG